MRRRITAALVSILLLILLVLFPVSGAAALSATDFTYRGDINEDGKVDVFDLLEMLKVLTAPGGKTDRQKQIADVNASGGVDVFDLLGLLKVLSGMEQPGVINSGPTLTYTVSGSVLSGGSGLSGVLVRLTGGGRDTTATTDADGKYSFTGLANGAYSVSFSKESYSLSQGSFDATISGSDYTLSPVTASFIVVPPPTYSISGSITCGGIGLSGVSVQITGNGTSNMSTTDTSGAYSFSGLTNGTYTVTPGKSSYTFSPTSQTATVNNVNATVGNFTATASGGTTPGDTAVVPEISLVSIPGVTFMMGTDRTDISWFTWSRPAHSVKLDSFQIGRYEITQEQYQAVVGSNPSKFKGNTRPVEQVSWYDAVTFCNKLSEAAGLQPCYNLTTWACDFTKNGYRLPTEAEWEYSCLAGTTTIYYTGDSASDLWRAGWYAGNSGNTTHAVGGKLANAFGLYDMHANVWEWCADYWYDNYGSVRGPDPDGANGVFRVLRGGSWSHPEAYCCSITRSCCPPNGRYGDVGFRVVRR